MAILNYDTILSAYDDKLTLMQWLKKVEKALDEAAATSFKVNKKGNATISFSIVFEDGSEIESGDIVLQQGESVAAGRIDNGHLILTLTNGDELDAGNLFNGNVNIVGDVSITGNLNADNITGDSIIENMPNTYKQNFKGEIKYITFTYASCVKNGNKLTFAIAGKINIPSGESYSMYTNMGRFEFGIPSSIGAMLYPAGAGGLTNGLSVQIINAFYNFASKIGINCVCSKVGNYGLEVIFYGTDGNTITNDVDYAFRWEETFLLSDNFIE